MAYLAASTNAGTRKQVNEDACCIEVAQTPLGEILMAIVCDGVGGLSRGNVASSTVIDRFAVWFERELPALIEGMAAAGSFDFGMTKAIWGALLAGQNELIRSHGVTIGARLGTTFTGIILCGGHYLVGHVGDCRAYRMSPHSFEQITEDQTLVAKRLAAGEITAEEAARAPKNVILQAVGSQRALTPAFYEGSFGNEDLFVMCCDGAYHKAENEGIRKLFQGLDYTNEAALQEACDTLLQFDMDCGEKDNLTVVCLSGAPAEARKESAEDDLATIVEPGVVGDEDDLATMVDAGDELAEDDLATMVEPEDESDEDDLATMVDAGNDLAEDELATMVAGDSDEDDLATMVESDYESNEDELATMVEANDDSDEDDLATMVADDDSDEDDLATMVADDEDDDWDEGDDPFAAFDLDLPTFSTSAEDEDDEDDDEPAWATDDEDDAPTMVADEDDDLPTMVDGGDA